MSWLMRLFDWVLQGLAWLSCFLFFAVVFAISYQVVMRYFFNMPPLWVNDFVEYSMLTATMLGAAFVLKEERHIEVDLITGLLTPEHQHLLKVVTSAAGCLTCAVVAWYGGLTVWDNYSRGIIVTKTMDFPKYLALTPVFVGAFLLTIQFLRRTLLYLDQYRRGDRGRAEKILQSV